MTFSTKLNDVISFLDLMFISPKAELEYSNSYQLMIAVILSAQTTDKAVNLVTKKLFDIYPDFLSLSKAEVPAIKEIIEDIGLANRKAHYLKETALQIINTYNNRIPDCYEELVQLKGIGRKTAHILLNTIFDKQVMAVDTHIFRVAKRLGIADIEDTILQAEKKLIFFFSDHSFKKIHLQLLLFGRKICKANKPHCDICNLKKYCKY